MLERYDALIEGCEVSIEGAGGFKWRARKLIDALKESQQAVARLEQERDELEEQLARPTWVCHGCGRVSGAGWIGVVLESPDGTEYEMECPNCHVREIEEDSAADLVRLCDGKDEQIADLQAQLAAAREDHEAATLPREGGAQ